MALDEIQKKCDSGGPGLHTGRLEDEPMDRQLRHRLVKEHGRFVTRETHNLRHGCCFQRPRDEFDRTASKQAGGES